MSIYKNNSTSLALHVLGIKNCDFFSKTIFCFSVHFFVMTKERISMQLHIVNKFASEQNFWKIDWKTEKGLLFRNLERTLT